MCGRNVKQTYCGDHFAIYTNIESVCPISFHTSFRKGRGTRDQIANIRCIIEKPQEFQKKHNISALLTMPKPLTMWITINCGKL